MFGLLAPGLSTEIANLDPLAGEQRRNAGIPANKKGRRCRPFSLMGSRVNP
jgi:hypothetical protein